jgi:ubiquitin fusion degradation protein 1
LDITDPKAVLERAFRGFTTLTRGDIISFQYNETKYDILVMEVKPDTASGGICIIETDLEVDFAPPVGYVEPSVTRVDKIKSKIQGSTDSIAEHVKRDTNRISDTGTTIKGKQVVRETKENGPPPALHLPMGKLFFGYPIKPRKSNEEADEKKSFQGDGITLRQMRKNLK